MTEFLSTTFSFPTVIFTVLLVVCCAYWLMVIVGALGIDALDFDFDGLDGAADGAAEGIVEGAAEGAAEGATEGLVEGATEGATEGVFDGAATGVSEGAAEGASFVGTLFLTFKLRHVPMTLVLSVWLLFSWTLSSLAHASLMPQLTALPGWLSGTLVVLGSLVVSLPLTSVLVRPLGRVLKVEKPTSKGAIIGQIVKIDTTRVDAGFGSGKVEDGGAGLIIRVRCDTDNRLSRGSKALVVSYDPKRDAYEVTPVDDMLPSEASRT